MRAHFNIFWLGLFCAIQFCPLMLRAQTMETSLTGKVCNQAKEPLPGITILIKGTGKGAATDINGIYRINGLAAGKHRLLVAGLGYQQIEKEVSLRAGQKLELDLQLAEKRLEMEEVLVVGKTQSELLEEKGFAVNAIDLKDIEVQSVQANDLLDQSAGVRIRQDGGLGSRVRYNINGLSGNSVRIFIDGIPMDNFGSSYSLSSIPTSLIERIEVYKGVVPADLGGDALGGAINVITKKNAPNSLSTSYSFGSFNTHQWQLNGNYRNSKSGLTVKGSAFYNYSDNDYQVWGRKIYYTNEQGKKQYIKAKRFHDSYESKGTRLDIGFTDVKWADQFMVGTLLSTMDKDIQNGATMEIVYGNRRVAQSTRMFHGTYSKRDFIVKGLDVNFFGSYSNLSRKLVDTLSYMYSWNGQKVPDPLTNGYKMWGNGIKGEGGEFSLNEDREHKYTSRLNLSWRLNRNNTLSVNYLKTDFKRKPDDPMRPARERAINDTRNLSSNILGVNFENEAFNARLKSSLFYKFFHQNMALRDASLEGDVLVIEEYRNNTEESGYGIALSYEVSPTIRLLSSAENTLRLPVSNEVFGNAPENISPSYHLKPERSYNVNLGFALGPYLLEKHSIKFNSNFFYRDVKGMIRPGVPDQLDETFPYENVENVLIKGIDTEINYTHENNLNWSIGLSLSDPIFNTEFNDKGERYDYFRKRLRNEPYFTANNNIRYNIRNFLQEKSRISFYYNLSYVHGFFRNWESLGGAGKDVIPSQLVNDIGLAYTFPRDKLTVSFDARNIFNEQVFDNWALQKPGRAFFMKMNCKIINL